MTLNDMQFPCVCRVVGVTAEGSLGQRLCDMGLCPGTDVYFVRSAPLYDPIHVRVGSYHVALRRAEAQHVQVSVNE